MSYVSTPYYRGKYILWSVMAVVAGGMIYLLFRPAEASFFHWFRVAGSDNWLIWIREKTLSFTYLLPTWLLYSLPNGLWAFAYTLIILIIWKGNPSHVRYVWFLSIPVLVFGFEFLQLTGTLPGTFCPHDLIWGALGIGVGYVTVHLKNYKRKILR